MPWVEPSTAEMPGPRRSQGPSQNAIDGVLLVDKPVGLTSHDVVARIRRLIGQRAVGHTGTLDPNASGLLALVLGRATKLASLLTGGDKTYEATIRLGVGTDTDDTEGVPLGTPVTDLPDSAAVEAALGGFRGSFDQIPPQHSAKKIGGEKAYDLARRAQAFQLAPVRVTVRALTWEGREGDLVRVRVTAAAGFYVRALARDLGATLGCGGHLFALRRTRSGSFDVRDALPLDVAERLGEAVSAHVKAPAEALPDLAAVSVTPAGQARVLHGNAVGPQHLEGRWIPAPDSDAPVRILGPDGRLLALGRARSGVLHPVVVLG